MRINDILHFTFAGQFETLTPIEVPQPVKEQSVQAFHADPFEQREVKCRVEFGEHGHFVIRSDEGHSKRLRHAMIVDDHPLFCDALSMALRIVVGIVDAPNLTTAIDMISDGAKPDVLLLGLNLPDVSGLDGSIRLKMAAPTVAVVVVSSISEPQIMRAAIKAEGGIQVPDGIDLDTGQERTSSGSTTAVGIAAEGYSEGRIVVIGFPASHFAAATDLVLGLGALNRQGLISRMIRRPARLTSDWPDWRSEFAILLVDGLSLMEDQVAADGADALGPMPTFGGAGGDGAQFLQTAVMPEDEVRNRTRKLEEALDLLNESNSQLSEAMREAETSRKTLADSIETVREGFGLFDGDEKLVLCSSRFGMFMSDIQNRLKPGLSFQDYSEISRRSAFMAFSGDIIPAQWVEQRRLRDTEDHVVFNVAITGDRWVQISEHRTGGGRPSSFRPT